MEPVPLYDLREHRYPDKRGDAFRSLQVARCWVCGAFSNRVVMGGYPGYGVRMVCPNSAECWHHELEIKIRWLQDHPHPRAYKEELEKEIEEMKNACKDKVVTDSSQRSN